MTEITGDAVKANAAQVETIAKAIWDRHGLGEWSRADRLDRRFYVRTAEAVHAALSPTVEQPDRLSALEAENARLRVALVKISDMKLSLISNVRAIAAESLSTKEPTHD